MDLIKMEHSYYYQKEYSSKWNSSSKGTLILLSKWTSSKWNTPIIIKMEHSYYYQKEYSSKWNSSSKGTLILLSKWNTHIKKGILIKMETLVSSKGCEGTLTLITKYL